PKSGRVLAFGGETWVWARESDASRSAHRKFWRQIIFWLSHKEDQGDNKVKVTLDSRRISVGQKLNMTATARDPKNAPITNVRYEASVSREDAGDLPQKIDDFFNDGEQARGYYLALGQPGTYKVTVTAFRDGRDIGRDSGRFLVYQDDRELENPAADLGLLRQLAQTTGGAYVPSEELPKYLKDHLDGKIYSDFVTQTEHKVWDNWPFFLLFTTLLTLEWWLRKRNGWV
ncbi:glutamine amidotransferase, partial [Singulisphaera rosea]